MRKIIKITIPRFGPRDLGSRKNYEIEIPGIRIFYLQSRGIFVKNFWIPFSKNPRDSEKSQKYVYSIGRVIGPIENNVTDLWGPSF